MTMTTKEAKRIAKDARRYGHHLRGSMLYVFCPKCRERISTEPYQSTVRRATQREAALDKVMIEHLTSGECGEATL